MKFPNKKSVILFSLFSVFVGINSLNAQKKDKLEKLKDDSKIAKSDFEKTDGMM